MNVYKYLNSKDVAEHLKKIGFEFSPLEAVRVIERCKNITLKEKHDAFLLLMEETSDEDVILPAEGNRKETKTTLHRLLNRYIQDEEELLNRFKTDEDGYFYEIQYVGFSHGIKKTFCHNYLTHQEMKNEIEKLPNRIVPLDTITEFCVNKTNTETKDRTFLTINGNGIPMSVENLDVLFEPYTILRFESGSRALPLPFEKGDLVCSIDNETPFVFLEENKETVAGYFLTSAGLKKHEIHLFPIEMEYCRKKPDGKENALLAVSDFVKEKIPLEEFANRYHKALLEGFAAAINN